MMHAARKFCSTLRILFTLGMARTFGDYQHTVWNNEYSAARYRWRGKTWIIPTGPVERES